MLHHSPPDDQGWYWIEDADSHEWHMAYLDTGNEELRLGVVVLDAIDAPSLSQMQQATGNYWRYVRGTSGRLVKLTTGRWIGPLTCPAGPFGGHIAEFSIESHEEAKASGKALVMLAADFFWCPGPCGTVAITGRMSASEVKAAQSRVFPPDNDNLLEAGAELRDPAKWAAMQIVKGGRRDMSGAEAFDLIESTVRRAIERVTEAAKA